MIKMRALVFRLLALAGLAALLLSIPAGRPAAAAGDAASDLGTRVVELTNVERQRAGLAPLVPNSNLALAAQNYAGVLAGGDCFAHTCEPVPDFFRRAENAGYTGWRFLGENIAGGQLTPEAVVAAWMASPGHRANILNGNYTEIGVGAATGGKYGMYWAEEFGARRSQPGTSALPAVALDPTPAPSWASSTVVAGASTLASAPGAGAAGASTPAAAQVNHAAGSPPTGWPVEMGGAPEAPPAEAPTSLPGDASGDNL